MTRSTADLAALKAELTNDPKTLGLDLLPEHDLANSVKLNTVSTVTPLLIKRRALSTATLFNAIDPIEHQALTDNQERYLAAVLPIDQIDPFVHQNIVNGVEAMFGAGTTSKPAVEALMTVAGNRIDQMFQEGLLSVGGTVTPSEVADARQLT
jgi:hypothetical protein